MSDRAGTTRLSEAPLLEHLVELRKRLIYSAITIVVLMAFCFIFASTIYDWLLIPYRNAVPDANLIFTAPQELFFTYLNVAFFGAVFLGFPIIASQIYMFVAPGLYSNEKRLALPFVFSGTLFFASTTRFLELFDPAFLDMMRAHEASGQMTDLSHPMPDDFREEVYRHYIGEIQRLSPNTRVSLCAETQEMWRRLGPLLDANDRSFSCNCSPIAIPGLRASQVSTTEDGFAELAEAGQA